MVEIIYLKNCKKTYGYRLKSESSKKIKIAKPKYSHLSNIKSRRYCRKRRETRPKARQLNGVIDFGLFWPI